MYSETTNEINQIAMLQIVDGRQSYTAVEHLKIINSHVSYFVSALMPNMRDGRGEKRNAT